MILPTKHMSTDRSLLGVGAELLNRLQEPKTVSRLWAEIHQRATDELNPVPLTYEWFVLALDFLYMIGAIHYQDGRIRKILQ